MAALIEPFTVGTRAARRGMPVPGENAVVFGAGTIGVAAALALKHIFGCRQVLISDLSEFRLEKARALGLETCSAAEPDLRGRLTQIFGAAHGLDGMTADVDIFVDAAGAASILDTFMKVGKIGSRFVAVAVNKALKEVDILHLTYAQKVLSSPAATCRRLCGMYWLLWRAAKRTLAPSLPTNSPWQSRVRPLKWPLIRNIR